ncbi:unnamed protein product [Brassica napus]|uniref:(rape) hypothetical protein n=1 Tax=Brassica napus TaxID=3708 RepID=A0A816VYZ6_BRANA|nr:unnamed protein product [Brassica napus]
MSSTMQAINKINNGTGSDQATRELDNFQPIHRALPSEESKHEFKAKEVKKTTGGIRKSRKLRMPLFNDLHQRLPSLLHSTMTVYINVTVTRIEKKDRYRTTSRGDKRRKNNNRSWVFFLHVSKHY